MVRQLTAWDAHEEIVRRFVHTSLRLRYSLFLQHSSSDDGIHLIHYKSRTRATHTGAPFYSAWTKYHHRSFSRPIIERRYERYRRPSRYASPNRQSFYSYDGVERDGRGLSRRTDYRMLLRRDFYEGSREMKVRAGVIGEMQAN